MELLTVVPLPAAGTEITFDTPVMFVGSCFANEIGYRMAAGKLPVMTNPHGTLFNPFSVAAALERFASGYHYDVDDLYLHQNRYLSLGHHTAFSSYEPGVLVDRLNGVSEAASSFIRSASLLFVTFGTSYIYTLNSDGSIVANCHKLPASLFSRRQASFGEIAARWKETLDRLAEVNPSLRVWFTVSPVRHLSDGAHANQLSKAQLLLATEELLDHPLTEGYFPAYEIFMDELRDYRYYASDMVHPSETAIDYIWEKFTSLFLSGHTLRWWNEASRITRAMGHRISEKSEESSLFASAMLEKIDDLKSRAPFLRLEDEESHFSSMLQRNH